MTVYGLHHVAVHVPPGDSLRAFWAALPEFGRVLLFLLGLAVTIAGLTLLTSGALGMRKGAREHRAMYRHRVDRDDDDEVGYGPQYGYR